MEHVTVGWDNKDNLETFRYGYGIFVNHDDVDSGKERYTLCALDDPEGTCTDHGIEGVQSFHGPDRDVHAAAFVQEQANAGDPICRKVIEFLIAMESTDVTLFKLSASQDW